MRKLNNHLPQPNMRNGLSAFFIHFFVTVFFVIVALAYFHPVLQGKVIEQSDIVQFTGMAKEQNDFRKKTGGSRTGPMAPSAECPLINWELIILMIM